LLASHHSFYLADAAPTHTSTLSLHDALPIFAAPFAAWLVRHLPARVLGVAAGGLIVLTNSRTLADSLGAPGVLVAAIAEHPGGRSEEHTSELQSRENLVCRLLLEKKNKDTEH